MIITAAVTFICIWVLFCIILGVIQYVYVCVLDFISVCGENNIVGVAYCVFFLEFSFGVDTYNRDCMIYIYMCIMSYINIFLIKMYDICTISHPCVK